MTCLVVRHQGARALQGSVVVPSDKSISHRAVMLAALAEGVSQVRGFLHSGDCLATLDCVRRLGIRVDEMVAGASSVLAIHGRGLDGLSAPEGPLDCRRSGTTMRLMAGLLAGQAFDTQLTGDPQLLRRPMRRITAPLAEMGAEISDNEGCAPLTIWGRERLRSSARLWSSDHVLSIASAQVKSAILLAGLYADGPVSVVLPGPARDHTERMLAAHIVSRPDAPPAIRYDALTARLDPLAIDHLQSQVWEIPGDFSSAAFLLAAGLVNSADVRVEGVGVNPTRTGLLDVLQAMGADVALVDPGEQGGEPVADVVARASSLRATEVGGETVVRMIDEFPIFALLATQAAGTTIVRDAAELRVKETDRIKSVVTELCKLGARIEARPDGFVVEGPVELEGAEVDSQGDHRLAMTLIIAGLMARGETRVCGAECIPDSFPGFIEALCGLGAEVSYGD
jgi:3-phosphoshikimate 1-carboxyvinyltransferase